MKNEILQVEDYYEQDDQKDDSEVNDNLKSLNRKFRRGGGVWGGGINLSELLKKTWGTTNTIATVEPEPKLDLPFFSYKGTLKRAKSKQDEDKQLRVCHE